MQIGGRGIFSARSIKYHPVFAAEAEIGEEHIDLLALEQVHRAGDVGGDVYVVIVFEQTPQSVARMLLIVNDQDNGLESHCFAWLNRQTVTSLQQVAICNSCTLPNCFNKSHRPADFGNRNSLFRTPRTSERCSEKHG